ncbi:MAG: DUF4010 domain-containing protein [Alphaproteobacteria bacterium]
MPFDNPELFVRLGVALAIGLLLGLERGWHARALPEGARVAGIRTFGIIGLLGGVAAILSETFGGLLLAAVFLALATVAAIGHWRASLKSPDVSITTTAAMLIAFALGALAGLGELAVAASGAVVITLLLGIKPELHGMLRRIERKELLATLRLLLISVVVLPVLPDQGYGPWEAINPYRIWWMVVLVAGISYVGYFAIRLAGSRRGILLTGLLGGLASSTAVAINFARLGKTNAAMQDLLAAGIAVAAATVFPRVLVLATIIAPSLFDRLVWPLFAASIVAFAGAAWYARRSARAIEDGGGEGLEPRNPLELKVAVPFGLLLAVVMVLARAFRDWLGETGLYLLAAVSGLGDVDAITLSLASMIEPGEASASVVAAATVLAVATGTASKPVLVTAIGNLRMGLHVAVPLLAALLAAAAVIWSGALTS